MQYFPIDVSRHNSVVKILLKKTILFINIYKYHWKM